MAERVFVMPDLGEGLEEGRIVRWLAAEGATVELNQPLVEVETAKAVVEIPSPFAGVIRVLHGSDGEDVPVGAPLVTFEVVDSVVDPTQGSLIGHPPTAQVSATPPVRKLAKELGIEIETVRGTGPSGRVIEEDVRAVAAGPMHVTRIELTPARRAIAANLEPIELEPLPQEEESARHLASARPLPASSARKSMTGSRTSGSNSSEAPSSYFAATRSSK